MKRLIITLSILASQVLAFSQSAKYSNDFLNIGVGARWLAMGNVGVASSTGVESAYWNPAGLAGMDQTFEVGAMHSNYFSGMASYNHIGMAYKPDTLSAMAFSIIRFGVDEIPNTIDLVDANGNFSYSRLKLFSVADYAFMLSYSRKLPIEGLTIGGNAKIVYGDYGKFANAWGFGIDAAARYQLGSWTLGANFRDVTTTINVWNFNSEELEITVNDSTYNRAPENGVEITLPTLSLGISRKFSLPHNISLLAEMSSLLYFGGKRNIPITTEFASVEPQVGLEASFFDLVFVRAGVNNLQKVRDFNGENGLILQPNIGLGVKFKGISVDYALTNIGSVGFTKYSNIFSLRWEFNKLTFRKSES